MPPTVRILTAIITFIAIISRSDQAAAMITAGLLGAFAVVTVISLWRAWPVAWHFTIATQHQY